MNNNNLKPLSSSKAREIGKKGGLNSVVRRRERKALKEQLLLLLKSEDIQENICIALINKAQNGDTKAFEVIRDTIGERPATKTEPDKMPPIALVTFVSPKKEDNPDIVDAEVVNKK